MRNTPEGQLKDKVIKYLTERKVWHFVYEAGSTYGLPDIIAIYGGRFLGIELKREDKKGKATGLQEEVIASIRRAGGFGVIISSMKQLEDYLDWVQQVLRWPTR